MHPHTDVSSPPLGPLVPASDTVIDPGELADFLILVGLGGKEATEAVGWTLPRNPSSAIDALWVDTSHATTPAPTFSSAGMSTLTSAEPLESHTRMGASTQVLGATVQILDTPPFFQFAGDLPNLSSTATAPTPRAPLFPPAPLYAKKRALEDDRCAPSRPAKRPLSRSQGPMSDDHV